MGSGSSLQHESSDALNSLPARYIKLRIDSGHEDFAAIYEIRVDGKR